MTKIMTVHSEEVYRNVMKQIAISYDKNASLCAISRKTGISRNTLYGWWRMGRKPIFKLIGPNGSHAKGIPDRAKLISPEKAYILGVICGDGYASYKGCYVMLEVKDMDFLNEFRRCMIKVYGEYFGGTINPTCNGKSRVVMCGKMMTEDIRRYLPKQRSFEWRVPRQILEARRACKAGFLKGFFDSEGSVNKHYSIELTCANKTGLRQIKKILMDLEIETGKICISKNAYKLYISGRNNIVHFSKVVGTTIPRKYEKMLYLLNGYGVSPRGES